MPNRTIQKRIIMLSICFSLSAFFLNPAHSFKPVRDDAVNSGIVQGLIQAIGLNDITIKGNSYKIARDVVVENAQGNVVSSGLKNVVPQMHVALSIVNRTVVRVRVFGLVRQ